MKRSIHTLAQAMIDVLERQAQADELNPTQVLQAMNALLHKTTENPLAEIRTAHELSEKSLKKIKSFLQKKLDKKNIEISVHIDPSIIGGFIARVGDQEFDFSIRSTLRSLQAYV